MKTRLLNPRSRLMAASALLSAALLAYQVAIIQLLSYVQWYHFANMVISIALLGFGAAGTLLSLKRKWLLRHSHSLLPLLMLLSALSMPAAVELSSSGLARFDSYLLFTERSQWLRLMATSLLYFMPFLFGALALGIIFTREVSEIGYFYFSNLAGSGAGALLAAVLSWYFIPAALPVLMALMVIAAAFLAVQQNQRRLLIALAVPIAVFIFYRLYDPVVPRLSEYKSLSRAMNLPSSRVTIQKPGPYGLVQLLKADALRYAPGLSLAFNDEVPVKSAVFNNGDWYGPVDAWNTSDSFHLLDYTTMALPYVLKKRNTVLLLHAATGLHTSHALSHAAKHIDAVEPHQGVARLLLNELTAQNDSMFYRPEVKMHITEPRSFLSACNKKYDLIQLPLVGSFGGGVGLFAMREQYSLTKEAFLKMWHLLEDDGVISITAWMDYPFRNALKITATLAETLHDAGITEPRSHLTAVRSWGTISFLIKKSVLTASDTSALRKFCNKYFFDPLWLPGLNAGERMAHNVMNDSTFFTYADELLYGNREKLYTEYGFHIRPAIDDKPYFSQFLRWKSLPRLSGIFGEQTVSFLELGWLIAVISFLQISLLAVLLILLPLFKPGSLRGGNRSWTLLYFSGLGIGYMFFEIVLIQHFILFFGNPVYAAAIVICVMMLSSGAGSYYSTRLLPNPAVLRSILLIIFLLLLLYTFFLSSALENITGLPDPVKIFIALIIVACPAMLMGMPFPLGLRAQAFMEEKNIPWAWGINGCMSVISAALASLLAVETGFSTVILFAAVSYAVSMFSMYLIKK